MTHPIAIIGGTGLDQYQELVVERQTTVDTPFGPPSAPVKLGRIEAQPLLFLPRHGVDHSLPPHEINYRANLHALHALGAKAVVAVNAVGAIPPAMAPGMVVVPHDLIDYTWGRVSSFSAPGISKITRESTPVATAKAMRDGKFALMRPVTTSTEGRWVLRIMWIPVARAI